MAICCALGIVQPSASSASQVATWQASSTPYYATSAQMTRVALSADGNRAIAVWRAPLDGAQGGPNVIKSATAEISGTTAVWGDSETLSDETLEAEEPDVVLSADGTQTTAAWNYTVGLNVYSKSATIDSDGNPDWPETATELSDPQSGVGPAAQISASADGKRVAAIWKADGDGIASRNATIVNGVAAWHDLKVMPNADGYPDIAMSGDGTRASAIWANDLNGEHRIDSMSAKLTANAAADWESAAHNLTTDSTSFGDDAHILMSASGGRAIAIWKSGNYAQSSSGTIASSGVASWPANGTEISENPSQGPNHLQVAMSADGTTASAVWRNMGAIETKSMKIESGAAIWGDLETLGNGGNSSVPELRVSADGTQATAVWTQDDDGVRSASADIAGNEAAWGATSMVTQSGGNRAVMGLSADGARSTAVWITGDTLWSGSAALTYTVAFYANGGTGSMTAQAANSPTALSANGFSRTGYTFAGWNTKADGTGSSYTNEQVYQFRSAATLFAQWQAPGLLVQLPRPISCVRSGAKPAIPRAGVRTLTRGHCITNAGQIVGTRIEAKTTRGDMRLLSLFCQVRGKLRTTDATGNGARYCTRGKLAVRTYGKRLKITVTWSAPQTSTYAAYRARQIYRT